MASPSLRCTAWKRTWPASEGDANVDSADCCARPGRGPITRHSATISKETIAEWARLKEQWLGEKKRAVLEQWEHVQLQRCLQEVEGRLSLQLRRMRLLQAQLA